eukprot:TRINITY_DN8777_c0_g1_i1.p1 TRINITY_DN8777_c0_g1~~TRINITY_DN8777_c0_g1_i1.p1  ORF type:complete len:567 (-),score=155.61 TRINITY_DN8777_c0_g1_i1:77-1777(-)
MFRSIGRVLPLMTTRRLLSHHQSGIAMSATLESSLGRVGSSFFEDGGDRRCLMRFSTTTSGGSNTPNEAQKQNIKLIISSIQDIISKKPEPEAEEEEESSDTDFYDPQGVQFESNASDIPTVTPNETVQHLDKFIIGQKDAKKAVAIALRNRWRRRQLANDLCEEIVPFNIMMIGPTGSGKTEVARRVAKLVGAPFLKTEATRYTEVGYVGEDINNILDELVQTSYHLEREKMKVKYNNRAARKAEEKLIEFIQKYKPKPKPDAQEPTTKYHTMDQKELRQCLKNGELDNYEVEISVESSSGFDPTSISSKKGSAMLLEIFQRGQFGRKEVHDLKLKVPQAFIKLKAEQLEKLLDSQVQTLRAKAVANAEQNGVVFLDEIDKLADSKSIGIGEHVKGKGVQKELLSLFEGATISTVLGPLRTNHILFICAGAFHLSKPSDLMPELQGRLPIRVTLEALTAADFLKILTETKFNLIEQTVALLETEGLKVTFMESAIKEIANIAAQLNSSTENIGARRLRTVIAKLTEDLSFHAHERKGEQITIDADFVKKQLEPLMKSTDLSRFIL